MYPSIIATKENHTGYMFPKIRVCHNSMHSKRKLNQFYPNVTDDLIMQIYGLDIQMNDGENVSFNKDKKFGSFIPNGLGCKIKI